MKDLSLYWVGRCTWIASEQLAQIMGCHVSTCNRRLLALADDGLVDYAEVGRGTRSKRRWCLTSWGVRAQYPVPGGPHRHPAPDGHTHDPFEPELDDHIHPPWWVSKRGAEALYKRVAVVEALYDTFSGLFRGESKSWHQGDSAPLPFSWKWLKGTNLVDAVGTFRTEEEEFRVGFCWVGKHLSQSRFEKKWEQRFPRPRLEWVSEAAIIDNTRDILTTPQDDDFDPMPQLAGYVMVGPDDFALRQTYPALPERGYMRPPAYLWVNHNSGLQTPEGTVISCPDDVASPIYDRHIGWPEDLCPEREDDGEPDDRPPVPKFIAQTKPLSDVLGSRILACVEEWSGLTMKQLQRLCHESGKRVGKMLMTMAAAELIQAKKGMYYLGPRGEVYVADRDGIHVNAVRARNRTAMAQDHRETRPHLNHTRGLNETMIRIREAGLPVYAGWREIVDIPGSTQIKPDALLLTRIRHGNHLEPRVPVFVEFERSAKSPAPVNRKLDPYAKAVEAGMPIWVVFVCESSKAARLFRKAVESKYLEEGLEIPVIITTLDEVKRGPIKGPGSIWHLMGTPVSME